MTELTIVMTVMSFLVSCATLFTFVRSRRNEAEERGKRQANLDNTMSNLDTAVEQIKDLIRQMAAQITAQQDDINKLKLWLELLLQQHNNNHGQEIRR